MKACRGHLLECKAPLDPAEPEAAASSIVNTALASVLWCVAEQFCLLHICWDSCSDANQSNMLEYHHMNGTLGIPQIEVIILFSSICSKIKDMSAIHSHLQNNTKIWRGLYIDTLSV